jgi:hypothetical protein
MEVSRPVDLATFGADFINTGLQPGVKRLRPTSRLNGLPERKTVETVFSFSGN